MPTTRVSRAGKGISQAENVEKTNIWYHGTKSYGQRTKTRNVFCNIAAK